MNPSTALPMGRERFPRSPSRLLSMFNFSANHLVLAFADGIPVVRGVACCSTATPSAFIACMTSPKPTPRAWPDLLRGGQGQQRR